jgi:translation initiation factor IF-1
MHTGTFIVEGIVTETLPNTLFRVTVDVSENESIKGSVILCHLAGKMRLHYIRILPGDRVRIEMTPYDKGKGRIIYKL